MALELDMAAPLVPAKKPRRKPTGPTPTALTLRHVRKAGGIAHVVERWNPHAKIRQDMFGFDVFAISADGAVSLIQCTVGTSEDGQSGGSAGARVAKCRAILTALPQLRISGLRLVVQAWRKIQGRWTLREIDL